MGVGEGESARGIWGNSSRSYGQGRNFRRGRKPTGALDRFAELLSEHDLETGDLGGNVRLCAQRMGIKPAHGNTMLQRIRQRLGPQAI